MIVNRLMTVEDFETMHIMNYAAGKSDDIYFLTVIRLYPEVDEDEAQKIADNIKQLPDIGENTFQITNELYESIRNSV